MGSTPLRQTWMDVVRGVCIVLVLLLHAYSLIMNSPGTETIKAFNLVFGPYRMPILMFLSGLLLHRSLGKEVRPYVYGKLATIFWPFLIWSLVVLAAEQRLTLENILKVPISSPTLLWYLWFLFAYYIIALVLKRLKVSFALVAVVALIASLFLPDFLRMSRFAYLLFFFLLGEVVLERDVRIVDRRIVAGLIAVAIAGAVLSVQGFSMSYNALYAWAPVSLVLAFYSLPRHLYEFPGSSFLQWIGRNSLVFYVVHFPVQVMFDRAISPLFSGNVVLLYALIFAVGLTVSALFVVLRNMSEPVAGLFDFKRLPIPATWRRSSRPPR